MLRNGGGLLTLPLLYLQIDLIVSNQMIKSVHGTNSTDHPIGSGYPNAENLKLIAASEFKEILTADVVGLMTQRLSKKLVKAISENPKTVYTVSIKEDYFSTLDYIPSFFLSLDNYKTICTEIASTLSNGAGITNIKVLPMGLEAVFEFTIDMSWTVGVDPLPE